MRKSVNYVALAFAIIVCYEAEKDYLRTKGVNDIYDFVDWLDLPYLNDCEVSNNA